MTRRLSFTRRWLQALAVGALLSTALGMSIGYDLFWCPKVEVTIRSSSEQTRQSQGSEVWFQLWRNSVTQVSPSLVGRDAGWVEKQGWLVATGAGEATAIYAGPYSRGMMIRFLSHPWSGRVSVAINGSITTLDLYNPESTTLQFPLDLPLAGAPSWIQGALTVYVSSAFLISLLYLFQLTARRSLDVPHWAFIGALLTGLLVVYAYPIDAGGTLITAGLVVLFGLITSGGVWYLVNLRGIRASASRASIFVPAVAFSLFASALWYVFWPAILSTDSIRVLEQVRLGAYSDWHPAAYVLLVGATQWFYPSPASMILLHLVGLVLVYVWGVKLLYRQSGGSAGAYLSWGLLILSPVSMVLLVTLWKDVPYGIALLALTVAAAEIYISRGAWLNHITHLLFLSAILVALSLFRHNGLPVAVFAVAVIMLVYPRCWRRLVLVLMVSSALIAIVRGPVYTAFGVSKLGVTHALFAHHLAAHVDAGTPIGPEDKAWIEKIRPVDGGWDYECGSVNPTVYNANYNSELAEANRLRLAKLVTKLALLDPAVELRHVLCVGSLVWRLTNDPRFLPYIFGVWVENGSGRYIYNNDMGFIEAGWSPALRNGVVEILQDLPVFIYRPAAWLYLLFVLALVFGLRNRDWRILVAVAPVAIHSTFLFLFNVAQDVRYQYPVFLVFGLFSPWFLWGRVLSDGRDDTMGRCS